MKELNIDGVIYVPKNKEIVDNENRRYCIFRTYSAGVFAGYEGERKGKEITIYNSRRLWYWDGAASLSQLAKEGVKKPENCKFAVIVEETLLTELIELVPCTESAFKSITEVKEWVQ